MERSGNIAIYKVSVKISVTKIVTISGKSFLQRKLCHSTASQDLVTTKVILTDSTAGPSYKTGLGHSTVR